MVIFRQFSIAKNFFTDIDFCFVQVEQRNAKS
jgi:hypothetical protein